MTLDQITPGIFVSVPFGRTSQVAHVVGITSTGRVQIRAWNRSRSMWMPGLRSLPPGHLQAIDAWHGIQPPALPVKAEQGMTQTQTIKAIRALGLTCTVTDGEFRVDYMTHRESDGTAHYTTDREDALGTAQAMVRANT
jgi:hypothetical protein